MELYEIKTVNPQLEFKINKRPAQGKVKPTDCLNKQEL
jgi:hypothetical protein